MKNRISKSVLSVVVLLTIVFSFVTCKKAGETLDAETVCYGIFQRLCLMVVQP